MADAKDLPEFVRALAARYGGRLVVVNPKGTGGDPREAPFLQDVVLTPAGRTLVP